MVFWRKEGFFLQVPVCIAAINRMVFVVFCQVLLRRSMGFSSLRDTNSIVFFLLFRFFL